MRVMQRSEPLSDCKDERNVCRSSDIYVVDDDPLVVEALERKLSGRSFRIRSYSDPLHLIEDVASCKPSAVLICLDMPAMDCIGVLKALRQREYDGLVLIVVDSGDEDGVAAAIRAGADDVLLKPIRDFDLDLIALKILNRLDQGKSLLTNLKTVIERIEQGVILLDSSLDLLFANSRALEVLAVKDERNLARVVKRNCPASVFDRCREKRGDTIFVDVNPSGQEKSVLVGLEVHYISNILASPYYLVLLHDFSQWRKLDELHTRFATYVSHSMRTPLTVARNAITLLGEKFGAPEEDESARLLEIGRRNVDKLVGSLDELQKIFMIESEEMNVCRTLMKIRKELPLVLKDMKRRGCISGFRLRAPDMTIVTGKGRLKDFLCAAIDAFGKWLQEVPFVECIGSVREDFHDLGGIDRKLKISLRARCSLNAVRGAKNLIDFLTYQEAHRRLVLDRLAEALDGEIEIGEKNSISLLLPMNPPFNRGKDLIHPLHMMQERAELSGGSFHLLSLKMVGVANDGVRFTKLLEESLSTIVSDDGMVARGEEPLSYYVFIINRTAETAADIMREVHERFRRSCMESGEEIYPSIRWHIRCSLEPISADRTEETSIIEEIILSG